ncbi:MAG: hypothetical protein AUI33_01200 [Ignavibacteria bacterium 13_1_40CM_2_61_4]|nr:MAG: hypothetical protein AUI33_01200 [Ignavibacteria bacterium 13_1_40CM_2_61_4]
MGPQRCRPPARFAVSTLLAAVGLTMAAVGAEAASNGLTLAVQIGYQDVVKPGEWTPVTIDLRNTGADVDGRLEIQQSLNAQPGVTGFTIYQQPISLASGASKRVRIFLVEDTTGATVTARVIQNGRITASQNSVTSSTTSTLIGVLSDQSSAFDDFAAVHPGGTAARVVHLHADDVADSAIALRAFDILAIDDFATDGLTARQRAAIADFVEAGGNLLLGTGAAWHKTLAGLPASILPVEPRATLNVHAARAVGGRNIEVAIADGVNGRAWVSEGAVPLIVDRGVGAGVVTLATFDWNQDPIAGWSGTKDLLRQVLARAVFGAGSSGANYPNGIAFGGPSPAFGSQPSIASKSNALAPVLGNLPGLNLPSLQLTAGLVLLYVLLVGPVNYLVLGAMRRRALAWITVPLIAVIAATGAYGAGVLTKGRSVQINQVAILHLQPGWDHAYQETYTGVIPPSRGDYQARIAGDRLLISPIATNNGGFPTSSGSSIRVNVATSEVTLSGMTAFSLGGFGAETMTGAPRLTGHVQLVNGKFVGTIENHSDLTFTDAVLLVGDSFQTIGALKPGATAAVNLVPKPTNATAQPLYTRIYTNGAQYYGPGAYEVSSGDRENLARTQILSILPTGANFKGVVSLTSPLLVAWTHQSFQDVTVNGIHPLTTAESAVVLSLPVDQLGTGPLPAGVLNGRIVDVVGDSQGQGQGLPGILQLQNGSVTYEFAPVLPAGATLTGLSVNAQNPYGPKFGPPGTSSPTGPTVTGQVWDWSRSAWTDIAYQDNGSTALPDSAVNPVNGLIRLRLSTTTGGLIGGSLTLSGTIK